MGKKEKDEEISLILAKKKIRRRNRHDAYRQRQFDYYNIMNGFDSDFELSLAAYRKWLEEKEKEKSYNALYRALEDLEKIDFVGYMLIQEYFFSENATTYTEIGRRHGYSRQSVTWRIKKSLVLLKTLVNKYKNE